VHWSRLFLRWLVVAAAFLTFPPVAGQTCSIPGQAGAVVTLGAQPNSFFPGTSPASAGVASVTIGAGTGVNRDIAAGDLLLIVQMQGADFDADNDNGYGDGSVSAGATATVAFGTPGYAGGATGVNFHAGTYEWAVAVGSVPFAAGGTVELSAPLQNSYFVQAGRSSAGAYKRGFQVVRVPQFSRAALGGNLLVQGWNGSTGGVLAIDVAGDLNLGGFTVDGVGRGFRGGGSVNGAFFNTTCTGTLDPPPLACRHYRQLLLVPGADSNAAYWGGSKGEGCSGTPGRLFSAYNSVHVAGGTGSDGYPGGDMGRGAPCNAGGGGNAHNAGGGGGGNGGAGGRGGNSWNDSRSNHVGHLIGGFGGAPSWSAVGTISINRLFMGGGGGAGDLGGNPNAVPNGSGGAGGGLVVLHASRVVASGASINVGGEAGRSVAVGETDAAGGGGAGGTVVIKANSLSGALAVNAPGGAGGNYTSPVAEQDGAGGGGGGGVLLTNVGGIAFNAAGGAAGASASTNCAPARPSANCGQSPGAAGSGSAGYAVFAPGVRTGYECLPTLTVTNRATTPVVTSSVAATAGYSISIRNSGGGVRFVDALNWALPPGWRLVQTTGIEYEPTGPGVLAAGAELSGTVSSSAWAVSTTPLLTPASGSNLLTWRSFALPPMRDGNPSSLTLSFTVSIPDTATAGTYNNAAGIAFLDSTRPAASTSTVSPLLGNRDNRSGVSYGSSFYEQYNGGTTTPVSGSNYSGLPAGPTADDVAVLPNLRVLKSVMAITATAGQPFTYLIAVQNVGRPIADQIFVDSQAHSQPATAIASNPLQLTDTLPAQFTATAAAVSPSAWTCSGVGSGTVNCAASSPTASAIYPILIGTLASPTVVGSITLTVSPRVDNCTSTAVVNTVTLSLSLIGEAVSEDNTGAIGHSRRCGADLRIAKTNGVTTVQPGQTTTYSITIANLGPSDSSGAVLSDVPSAGLESCAVISCSSTGAASCPASNLWASLLPPSSGLTLTSWPASSTYTFRVQCLVASPAS
jgi:uncharacterized repeat protein (TIGR01451 family)